MTTQSIEKVKAGDVFYFVGQRYTAATDAVKDNSGWVRLTAQKTFGGLRVMRLTEHDIVRLDK